MNRALLLKRLLLVTFVAVISAATSRADTTDAGTPDLLRDYRFIPSQSTVVVSGGLPTFSVSWNVAGKFGLATGYDGVLTPTPSPTATPPALSGHASFVNVNGILFHAPSANPTPDIALDLDSTLNLSGLKGTFKVPSDIHFTGDDGQGIPIQLEAVIHGPLLHLTGATLPVPTCASCGINMYKVNAFATISPYADFNLDGKVDNSDLRLLMSNIGMTSGATFEQGDADGDGDVDGADFVIWQRTLGAATSLSEFDTPALGSSTVPEPATIALLLFGTAMWTTSRKRCV